MAGVLAVCRGLGRRAHGLVDGGQEFVGGQDQQGKWEEFGDQKVAEVESLVF